MHALEGVRVLDLSRLVPGPYATMLLADLGAEVVKIEEPAQGDYLRGWPPAYRATNAAFCMLNRGKKSATLNLKSDEGRRRFLELARRADVVVESWRPGVADRLGVGWEAVRAANPRVVYCSIFGGDDTPGHDLNYLGVTGVLDGMDGLPSVLIADIGGGAMTAVFAILAALFARERGGGGQRVDVSMIEAIRSWMFFPGAHFFAGEETPRPLPLAGGLPIYGIYVTKDGKRITLAALEPKFAAALGVDAFDREAVAALMRSRTRDEWLARRDLPVAPVLTVEEALRGHVVWVDDPAEGRVANLPFPVRFSGTPARAPSRSPSLGEHTKEVLGLSDAEEARLRAEGVI